MNIRGRLADSATGRDRPTLEGAAQMPLPVIELIHHLLSLFARCCARPRDSKINDTQVLPLSLSL